MKKPMSFSNIVCGLDIGTTKVAAIIAETNDEGDLQLRGLGHCPSHGLRRGIVVNLEETTADIERALQEAEREARVQVSSVWAGIAGEHIRGINSRGVIPVTRQRSEPIGEVTDIDVKRVVEAASAIALPMDRRMIHTFPQEFIVDKERGIKKPVGMAGVRLEADVHLVTAAVSSMQNIYKCARRAGVTVREIVLQPLASAYAVLTPDERELGVVLIDLGGGTSDVAIFFDGTIRHTAVVAYGGDYVTRDIAHGLRTPLESAERIKREHGAATEQAIRQDELIQIPGVGGRPPKKISRSILVSIIRPRLEEILTMAREEIREARCLELVTGGVVLTGGGAQMPGIEELAETVFDMPVRIGSPDMIGREEPFEPQFATGVGLVRYAQEQSQGISGNGNGSWLKKVGHFAKQLVS